MARGRKNKKEPEMQQKKPMGRPRKWDSVADLQAQIDEYFDSTPLGEQTITGLALHLGTNRETLCNYERSENFFDTIKTAKARIEHAYEMRGLDKGGAFDIFRLKNMGWKDKYEQSVTVNKTVDDLTDEELMEIAKRGQ